MTARELYEVTAAPPGDLLRRYTMPELLAEPDDFEWLIRGLLAHPTYGQIAGEMKTLKSHGARLHHGRPGVGRADLRTRSTRGSAAGPGLRGRGWPRTVDPAHPAHLRGDGRQPGDLDLHPCFDVAPIASLVFQESLRRDLDELTRRSSRLDPLYTYHGTDDTASDLHQEGALLNQLSTPCIDAGASLLVVNHFNQTGGGSSLKRITMAGSGEWADSWVLLEHREKPDVAAGMFTLTLEIGSRQWGGSTWELDLDIGRFDEETGTHDGEITWDLRRSSAIDLAGRSRATPRPGPARPSSTLWPTCRGG